MSNTHLGRGRPTIARIGLGRAGAAIATTDQLQFQLDHALARDAVTSVLNTRILSSGLAERGLHAITLRSAIFDTGDRDIRRTYLRRPDLGRLLSAESTRLLGESMDTGADIAFVLADGLSSLAIERHALPTLDAILALLPQRKGNAAPICVAEGARVAIGDSIGHLLGAQCAVVLIGERPGLSAADSLGIYITWSPRPGRTDAERNCISNIRPEGLSYTEAAHRLLFYFSEARRLQCTGVALKSNATAALETSS